MDLSFRGSLVRAKATDPWVFIHLPGEEADTILEHSPRRPGFGSVRVEVTIGTTTWKTSIFPSKADRTYLLPVKRAVRSAEAIDVGDTVDVDVTLL